MVDVYNAPTDLERRRQFDRMIARTHYLATVIDHPRRSPGSIELADAEAIETMLRGWNVADSAA